MIHMEQEEKKLLEILSLTPLTKPDAENIVSEEKLEQLIQSLFVIEYAEPDSIPVIMQSPLYTVKTNNMEMKNVYPYKKRVETIYGSFASPIQLIEPEERRHLYSLIINKSIEMCNVLMCHEDMTSELKNKRIDILEESINGFFETFTNDEMESTLHKLMKKFKIDNQ